MKVPREKLTYANVVSTLCLFMLVGGGAAFAATQLPKNSVGARQLKKGAVTPVKLSRAAKRALAGSRGPRGLTGAQGLEGPPGPAGAPGAPGSTDVVVRVGPEEVGSEAFCHSGEVAVGGGGITLDAEKQLLFGSRPVTAAKAPGEGEKPIGWLAAAEDTDGNLVPSRAYVLCASS